MKQVNFTIRVNEGYHNYPKEISFYADDKLADLIYLIENNRTSNVYESGDSIYVHKTGLMSKDSGFNIADFEARKYGGNIGLFYSGVRSGTKYVDLDKIKDGGSYRFEDLINVY